MPVTDLLNYLQRDYSMRGSHYKQIELQTLFCFHIRLFNVSFAYKELKNEEGSLLAEL